MEYKVFKDDEYTTVYQKFDTPESIFKKYYIDGEAYKDRKDLEDARNKLKAIKNCENWPEFVIKPTKLYPLYKTTFTAEFPFIEGQTLAEYQKDHQFTLKQCAELLSDLENKLLNCKKFVFPDVANSNNIIIKPQDEDDKLGFVLIDPDDIQFNNYRSIKSSSYIAPVYSELEDTRGLQKCLYKNYKFNKQLDIRSMYALFYLILNCKDWFYPLFVEMPMKRYFNVLDNMGIPRCTQLYINSLMTLDDEEKNPPISDALLELVDDGYEFEAYDKDSYGYSYRIVRK